MMMTLGLVATVLLFACVLGAAPATTDYRDEDSDVVWITYSDSSWYIAVNGRDVRTDRPQDVLKHFYARNYDVVGHGMGFHHNNHYSWTLQKRRDACIVNVNE